MQLSDPTLQPAPSRSWAVGDQRSLIHTFSSDEMEVFARLTGDNNPLHMNKRYAERTQAGGQVVHGMLAAAFISTLIGVHIPGAGALWNSFHVNWRRMIRLGDTLRFEATVTAVHEATNMLDLEIVGIYENTGEIYLDGKARVMMMPKVQDRKTDTLCGKRILVTGATGTLGDAVCSALAAEGAELVLWGRNEIRLEELSSGLGKSVVSCHAVDLQNPRAIDAALEQSLQQGPIFGFIHAAAAPLTYKTVDDESNAEQLRLHWTIAVAAFSQIAQRLAVAMKEGGVIVTILTQAVFDAPPPKMSAYVSAKLAAWGMLRSFALELGPRGIRCNAVSPNMMDTPYTKDTPIRIKQVEAATNPLRRLCQAEDVAEAVLFLAGGGAGYINGANIPVTGGARMP